MFWMAKHLFYRSPLSLKTVTQMHVFSSFFLRKCSLSLSSDPHLPLLASPSRCPGQRAAPRSQEPRCWGGFPELLAARLACWPSPASSARRPFLWLPCWEAVRSGGDRRWSRQKLPMLEPCCGFTFPPCLTFIVCLAQTLATLL